MYNENFDRIIESNKVPFGKKGFKYFIRHKDGKNVGLLCVIHQI